MTQQTAVEYLFNKLWDTPKDKLNWYAILKEAKQMEKEQMKSIQLPSNEEIDRVARDKIDLSSDCFGQYDFTSGKQDGFYEGAIWMRDKILNK